jgi:hypothetical protein
VPVPVAGAVSAADDDELELLDEELLVVEELVPVVLLEPPLSEFNASWTADES